MKVVLDANVFVSAAIAAGPSQRIVQAWLETGSFEVVICPTLVAEVREVLTTRPRLRKWISLADAGSFIDTIATLVDLVADPEQIDVGLRDSDDDHLVCPARAGFAATHVGDHELLTTSDPEIFEWAIEHEHVLITADSDFGALRALRRTTSPSVVLLRDVADQTPEVHARVLIENLAAIENVLTKGPIVSLSLTGLRVRDLPIR